MVSLHHIPHLLHPRFLSCLVACTLFLKNIYFIFFITGIHFKESIPVLQLNLQAAGGLCQLNSDSKSHQLQVTGFHLILSSQAMVLLSTSGIRVRVAIVCWQGNFTEESLLSRAAFNILCTMLILNLFLIGGVKCHSSEMLREGDWGTSVCSQVKYISCMLLFVLVFLLLDFLLFLYFLGCGSLKWGYLWPGSGGEFVKTWPRLPHFGP